MLMGESVAVFFYDYELLNYQLFNVLTVMINKSVCSSGVVKQNMHFLPAIIINMAFHSLCVWFFNQVILN